jgi:hypothetical protein
MERRRREKLYISGSNLLRVMAAQTDTERLMKQQTRTASHPSPRPQLAMHSRMRRNAAAVNVV